MTHESGDARKDVRGFRSTLGLYGTGVAIVTAAKGSTCFGMTINSFASVSLQPPMILWSVGNRASNFVEFCEAERFAIHVLDADQAPVSDRFAQTGEDKFLNTEWEFDECNVPRIKGCLARFECVRRYVYPGGDHQIIVGEVDRFESASGAPLLFVRGRYFRAGELEPVLPI